MTIEMKGLNRTFGVFPQGATPVNPESLPVNGKSSISTAIDSALHGIRETEAATKTRKPLLGEALDFISATATHFLSFL